MRLEILKLAPRAQQFTLLTSYIYYLFVNFCHLLYVICTSLFCSNSPAIFIMMHHYWSYCQSSIHFFRFHASQHQNVTTVALLCALSQFCPRYKKQIKMMFYSIQLLKSPYSGYKVFSSPCQSNQICFIEHKRLKILPFSNQKDASF